MSILPAVLNDRNYESSIRNLIRNRFVKIISYDRMMIVKIVTIVTRIIVGNHECKAANNI